MVNLIKFLLCVLIFFNVGEILFEELPRNETNIFYIILFTLSLFSILFFKVKTNVKKKISREITKKVLLVGVIGTMLLLFFIESKLNGYNIIELLRFIEEYRNGFYRGSGIFTFISTNIYPLILSYFMVKYSWRAFYLMIAILLALAPVILLGLRIFIYPIIFAILISSFEGKGILNSKSLFLSFSIFLIMLGVKKFIALDQYDDSTSRIILKIATRTNYQAMTIGKPTLKNAGFFTLTDELPFKERFYNENNFHIDKYYLSQIEKTSGLAMPLPILLVNTLGPALGSVLFLYLIFLITIIAKNNENKLTSSSYFLLLFLIASMVEDYSLMNKIILIPFLSATVYLLTKVRIKC